MAQVTSEPPKKKRPRPNDRHTTSPKVQVTAEPMLQPKRKHPQLNDSHTKYCNTTHILLCVLVVVGLCLVGGSVYWVYSLLALGPIALNQGEGMVAVLCEMFVGRLARMGNIVCLLTINMYVNNSTILGQC